MPRPFQIIIFFVIALSLIFGLHYYLWLRLVRDAALGGYWARAVTALLAGLAVSLPAAMILSRLRQGPAMRPIAFLAFSWMGIGFIAATLFFATDLGHWLINGGIALSARLFGTAPTDPSRRLFISRALAGTVAAGVSGLAALGFHEALGEVGVVEVDVKLKNLPEQLAGFRLVQISDVHIGPLLHKEWLAKIVARIRTLKPDLVAITGDLVDGSVADLREHVAPLADLNAVAPRGVFFVTGNHEYYSGVEDWLAHLPTLGVQPLRNERREVAPGLWLAGIDDLTARGGDHGPDLKRALAGRDPSKPVVLLAHQPKQFIEASEAGVDLTLSGHTHGGQIWPFVWLVSLVQPYVAGLHKRKESQLYVSRGTGFWGPPLRVGAPPEITLLRLQPA